MLGQRILSGTSVAETGVDLARKIAVITGANSGVGYETSLQLARRGCLVVMCCRSMIRAAEARRCMLSETDGIDPSNVRIVQLDLADMENIAGFRSRYDEEMSDHLDHAVDMLILNAGVMGFHERQLSKDGIELQMATNCIGHFKFCAEMIDKCKAAPSSRIVWLSSPFHKLAFGQIDFDDFNRDKHYWKFTVYGETKFGILLLMIRLNRLLQQSGINNVVAVASHAGFTATKLYSHIAFGLGYYFAQSVQTGAKPTILAATDPAAQRNDFAGCKYCFELYGGPSWNCSISPEAFDVKLQDQFWERCEQLSHANFEQRL